MARTISAEVDAERNHHHDSTSANLVSHQQGTVEQVRSPMLQPKRDLLQMKVVQQSPDVVEVNEGSAAASWRGRISLICGSV